MVADKEKEREKEKGGGGGKKDDDPDGEKLLARVCVLSVHCVVVGCVWKHGTAVGGLWCLSSYMNPAP